MRLKLYKKCLHMTFFAVVREKLLPVGSVPLILRMLLLFNYIYHD
jgi:hypothetical protein